MKYDMIADSYKPSRVVAYTTTIAVERFHISVVGWGGIHGWSFYHEKRDGDVHIRK
jgi:hypothetical protein